MQNLLDNPNDVGMLSLGLRLLSTPGKFGQALGTAGLGAMGDMQQAKQAQAMAQQRALQQEMQRMQVEQIKRQQMEQEQQRAAVDRFKQTLRAPGAAGDGIGPPQPNVDPRLSTMYDAMQAGIIGPMDYVSAMQPKESAPIKLGAGDSLIDPATFKPLFTAPAKAEALPSSVREYQFAQSQGYKGTFEQFELARKRASASSMSVSYGAPVAGVGPDGNPLFFQPSKDGGAPSIIQGVAPPKVEERALTEGQAKALTFSSRMLSAENTLSELSQKGVNVSVPGSRTGFGIGAAINAVSSPEQQRLDQAKRDFINATLRRESGAVIADSEFDNADKQYFPQVGDSRAVIEQKARNRRSAIEGVRADVPAAKQGEVDRIAGQGGGPVRIRNDADYKALPSGALFVGPDGKTRRKP